MRYIKYILMAAVLGFGLVSCTGKFEDLNTNPNKNTVGTVQAYNLFEPIFYATGKWTVQFAYRIIWVKELLENKIQQVGWNHIMKDIES